MTKISSWIIIIDLLMSTVNYIVYYILLNFCSFTCYDCYEVISAIMRENVAFITSYSFLDFIIFVTSKQKKTCMFCFQIYMSWYLLKTDTKIWKFQTFSGGFILIFILFYFYLFFDIGVEKSLRKLDHFAVKRSTPLKKFIANFFLFFRC